MIKKLDWYIIKKYIGTFIFAMAMLISIAIVIDVTEKIEDFTDNNLGFFTIAFKYYVYFIPYIGALLSPFFIFIAVIFFTSQMAGKSEIVAILSSGISYPRMLYPYFLSALFLAVGLFYTNNYWVPYANVKKLEFESKYIYKTKFFLSRSIHRQMDPGKYMYVDNYSMKDTVGYKFTIEEINEQGKLVKKLHADRIKWIAKDSAWNMQNYYEITLNGDKETITHGKNKLVEMKFTPQDFGFKTRRRDAMTTPELKEYIAELKAMGDGDTIAYEVEVYRRTSSAFSIFILTLIGVAISSRKVRGGLGFHLVMGIALCSLYEVVWKFTTTFSLNAGLPVLLGVWLPNMIYACIAVVYYIRAQK